MSNKRGRYLPLVKGFCEATYSNKLNRRIGGLHSNTTTKRMSQILKEIGFENRYIIS